MISAEIICDSISEQDKRLTTFKLRYPKFIHGEFMTHRVISRNASSSRAIPTKKLLEEVRSDTLRAGPVFWGKNQSGMQAAEELTGQDLYEAKATWRVAADMAATYAEMMVKLGVHKQIVNRLLEPFSHINVVATATEWDNFFGLRLHKDAQPEMRALTVAMWEAMKANCGPHSFGPTLLKPGGWHLPFVSQEEHDQQKFYVGEPQALQIAIRMSVARCARVSYESFETGKRSTVEEDLKLYDRLVGAQPLHASPAEHQATPDVYVDGDIGGYKGYMNTHKHGNFVGWLQHRKMLKGEAVAPLPEEYLPF